MLSPINLEAKLCGALVRTSWELSKDSPLANNLIQQVMTNAATKTLDWALLAADGQGTGDLDIRQAFFWGPVSRQPVPSRRSRTTTPSPMHSVRCWRGDGMPTAMIAGVGFATWAVKLNTAVRGRQRDPLAPPRCPRPTLPKYFSSTLGTNAVVGDFSMLAWGLRTDVTLEIIARRRRRKPTRRLKS